MFHCHKIGAFSLRVYSLVSRRSSASFFTSSVVVRYFSLRDCVVEKMEVQRRTVAAMSAHNLIFKISNASDTGHSLCDSKEWWADQNKAKNWVVTTSFRRLSVFNDLIMGMFVFYSIFPFSLFLSADVIVQTSGGIPKSQRMSVWNFSKNYGETSDGETRSTGHQVCLVSIWGWWCSTGAPFHAPTLL